jgi:hypothetical protein
MLARVHEWQEGHGRPGGRADAARRLGEAHKLLDEITNMLTEARREFESGPIRDSAGISRSRAVRLSAVYPVMGQPRRVLHPSRCGEAGTPRPRHGLCWCYRAEDAGPPTPGPQHGACRQRKREPPAPRAWL